MKSQLWDFHRPREYHSHYSVRHPTTEKIGRGDPKLYIEHHLRQKRLYCGPAIKTAISENKELIQIFFHSVGPIPFFFHSAGPIYFFSRGQKLSRNAFVVSLLFLGAELHRRKDFLWHQIFEIASWKLSKIKFWRPCRGLSAGKALRPQQWYNMACRDGEERRAVLQQYFILQRRANRGEDAWRIFQK